MLIWLLPSTSVGTWGMGEHLSIANRSVLSQTLPFLLISHPFISFISLPSKSERTYMPTNGMIAILLKCHLSGGPNFYFTENQSTTWHKILVSGRLRDVRCKTCTFGRVFGTNRTSFLGFYWNGKKTVPEEMQSCFKIAPPVTWAWWIPVAQTGAAFLPSSPQVVWKLEPLKASKVNSVVPHTGVDHSPRGILDSALSTLILNI